MNPAARPGSDTSIAPPRALDADRVREQFPILRRQIGDRPLVYLDSAATTQKPQSVIDAVSRYYEEINSNVHRGVHRLSEEATNAYEGARKKIRTFINAKDWQEIVWVRGTTEGINLVAQSWGRSRLGKGDEVLLTTMEHHSNIVPWQILCEQTGATLRIAPIGDDGSLLLEEFEKVLSDRTRVVAVTHASNALGTVNPIREIVALAHAVGAVAVIDGAQATAHLPVDVRDLDCDFYAFSGHKMFGPTGIGALYAKREHLEAMPPWMGGGDMISMVTFRETHYSDPPFRFEAGTPNIAGAVGMGAAVDFITGLGIDAIGAHERGLLEHGTARLGEVEGLRLIGTAPHKSAVFSFVLEGIHPHDIGTILDRRGIAIRTGHHCAQPVMQRFRVPATARASVSVYNTRRDLDDLVEGLEEVNRFFR
jgi:cysteine desulfurase/selenocysteine lyase